MAVQKEIWEDYIEENLFKNNEHLEVCMREDENVYAGKIVHIPQSGAKPVVVKNRTTVPKVAVKRADGDIVYIIEEYTTDTIVIPNAEKIELSYDKIDNVMREHINALKEFAGDEVFYNWLSGFTAIPNLSDAINPAGVLRTSGGNVTAHLGGASGNRKLFIKEDLQKARTYLNKQNISTSDRYAVISSDMLDQLSNDADLKKRDNALELDMESGVIKRLYGFNILERPTTAVYNNGATPAVKAPDAASAGTDNDAVVCFHKSAVSCAVGDVKFFDDLDNPEYYGDVYSALFRLGGRKRRADAKGIVAIVQAAV